jgi:hypothetical protein
MFVFIANKAHIFHNNILVKTVDKHNNLYPMLINKPGASKKELQNDKAEAHALVNFIDHLEIVELAQQAKPTQQSSRTINSIRSESPSFNNAQDSVSTAKDAQQLIPPIAQPTVVANNISTEMQNSKSKTSAIGNSSKTMSLNSKSEASTLGVPARAMKIAEDILKLSQGKKPTGTVSSAISHGITNQKINLHAPAWQGKQESAFMQRVFIGGANFKQLLHARFNHQSVSKGTPLYKACAELYGKQFTECPDVVCDICIISKAHRLPHPRSLPAERQRRVGDGAHGEWFIDTYSMPYPGEHGERTVCVMTDL